MEKYLNPLIAERESVCIISLLYCFIVIYFSLFTDWLHIVYWSTVLSDHFSVVLFYCDIFLFIYRLTSRCVVVYCSVWSFLCCIVLLWYIFVYLQIDFTMCSGLLFCLVMVLFFFGLSCFVFYFVFPPSVFSWRVSHLIFMVHVFK